MMLITLGVVNLAFAIQQGMLLEEAAAAGAQHGAFTNYNSALSGIPQYATQVAGGKRHKPLGICRHVLHLQRKHGGLRKHLQQRPAAALCKDDHQF